jgi:hypothetical protein
LKQVYLTAEALYCGTRLLELEAVIKPWLLLLFLFLFLFFLFCLDISVDSAWPALYLSIRYNHMVLFMVLLFNLGLLLNRFERVIFRAVSFFMMGMLRCLKMFPFLSFRTYVSLDILNRALSFKDMCSGAVLGVSALQSADFFFQFYYFSLHTAQLLLLGMEV